MSHIFISYSHEDGDFSENLKVRLEREGFEVWTDESKLIPGEDWRADIDQAVRGARALIVIMTPEAKASEYVTYEWAFAWGVGVKVVPILLRPTALHPRLEALHYLDFTSRTARPWDNLFKLMQEIPEDAGIRQISARKGLPPIIQNAIAKLDSMGESERKQAVIILAQTTHSGAYKALRSALDHPLPDVRGAAAQALGRIKDAIRYTFDL
jgi:hypothetical protein